MKIVQVGCWSQYIHIPFVMGQSWYVAACNHLQGPIALTYTRDSCQMPTWSTKSPGFSFELCHFCFALWKIISPLWVIKNVFSFLRVCRLNYLFWTNANNGEVWRAALSDGSNVTRIISGLKNPCKPQVHGSCQGPLPEECLIPDLITLMFIRLKISFWCPFYPLANSFSFDVHKGIVLFCWSPRPILFSLWCSVMLERRCFGALGKCQEAV